MFRLIVAILLFLMTDWIFFNGDLVVRRLGSTLESLYGTLADLIIRLVG